MMLASGYTPVYAAHVSAASYRTGCVGTGPFKLKEWRKGEFVEYVKNPDYFVKGRPYLDELKYVVITEPGTRIAALQTGQVDVSFPQEVSKTNAEQLKTAVPKLVITPYSVNVNDNMVMNIRRPPFDNPKVRLAVSHGIDRRALVQAVHQGGASSARRWRRSHTGAGVFSSLTWSRSLVTENRRTRRTRRGSCSARRGSRRRVPSGSRW